MEFRVGAAKLIIIEGDITDQDTDAIVNAANSSLMGGGGVDGAIHRKGGRKIVEECLEIRKTTYKEGLPPGQAVVTSGGNLKARFVIHAVGPVWRGGGYGEEGVLSEAYYNSLRLCEQKGLTSVSFPAISTGAYGYPFDEACRVALDAIIKFLHRGKLKEVRLVLYNEKNFSSCLRLARQMLG